MTSEGFATQNLVPDLFPLLNSDLELHCKLNNKEYRG